jgi:endoglucanase
MTRQPERMGWSWSFWQFDSDFVVRDIDRDRCVTPILNALVPPQA